MRPCRPIDWNTADFSRDGGYKGQVLYSGESCHVIASLVPPGVSGPPRHVHASDQLYFVVEGELAVTLGTEERGLRAGDGLFIPAGLPHCNRNVDDATEVHLEIIAPGVGPAEPLAHFVDHTDGGDRPYVVASPDGRSHDRPFTMTWLLNRAIGSEHAGIYVADMAPGASGPTTHVHDFDQFYFVLDGSLHVEVGLQHHVVEPGTLVVLPSGVPHRQWNPADVPERHLAVLVPEPEQPNSPEHRWDTVVDFAARQLD